MGDAASYFRFGQDLQRFFLGLPQQDTLSFRFCFLALPIGEEKIPTIDNEFYYQIHLLPSAPQPGRNKASQAIDISLLYSLSTAGNLPVRRPPFAVWWRAIDVELTKRTPKPTGLPVRGAPVERRSAAPVRGFGKPCDHGDEHAKRSSPSASSSERHIGREMSMDKAALPPRRRAFLDLGGAMRAPIHRANPT